MLINPPCTICLTHSHCSKYDAMLTAQYLHACPHPCMRVPRHEVWEICDEMHGKSVLISPGILPRASLHDQASRLQGRLATLCSLFLLHQAAPSTAAATLAQPAGDHTLATTAAQNPGGGRCNSTGRSMARSRAPRAFARRAKRTL